MFFNKNPPIQNAIIVVIEVLRNNIGNAQKFPNVTHIIHSLKFTYTLYYQSLLESILLYSLCFLAPTLRSLHYLLTRTPLFYRGKGYVCFTFFLMKSDFLTTKKNQFS